MSWQKPITNRTKTDVDALKSLALIIQQQGWDNVSPENKIRWMLGNPLTLVASDGGLLTSDLNRMIVGDGVILGALNAFDLNRIENNTKFINDILTVEGYNLPLVFRSNPWRREDYVLLQDINRMRDNVNLLKTVIGAFSSTPPIQYTNPMNWLDVNALEKNLEVGLTILDNIKLSYVYCGTFSCGQDVIL